MLRDRVLCRHQERSCAEGGQPRSPGHYPVQGSDHGEGRVRPPEGGHEGGCALRPLLRGCLAGGGGRRKGISRSRSSTCCWARSSRLPLTWWCCLLYTSPSPRDGL